MAEATEQAVVVVPAAGVAAADRSDRTTPPKDYHRGTLGVLVPLLAETASPISSPDSEIAARRGIPVNEAIRAGLATAAPESGETWHTHPDFVDTILYVAQGTATFWWRDGEREERRDVGPGDFVFVRPGATHQWLNTGADELRFVFFQHSHDYGTAP